MTDKPAEEIARVAIDRLRDGEFLHIDYPPYHVMLARVNGVYHAIEATCPHSGELLTKGQLCGQYIVCPAHDWEIDVTDGHVHLPRMTNDSCPVFVVRTTDTEVIVLA